MRTKSSHHSLNTLRQLGTLLTIALGLTAASIPLQATEEISFKVAIQTDSTSGRTNHGGGGDIILFDIVDSTVDSDRPAGGDIVVFDIIDATVYSDRPAGGGDGGDIIVFDIVDSVAAIYMCTEAASPGLYKALLVEGEREMPGFVSFEETSKGKFVLSFIF